MRKVRLKPAAPKVLNYMRFRALPRQAKMSVKRYTPQIGSIWVTLRCNLSCNSCAAAKILHDKEADWRALEVDLEMVKRLMANPLLRNALLIDLEGGEPLLVKDLDRIVAYLTETGHITNTTTNGLLLAERIQDLKEAGISRISVSFYDLNRSVIERDIEKINKIFPVHMSIILTRTVVEKEQDKIIKAATFLRESGCLSLRFWMYRLMGVNPDPNELISDTDPAYLEFRRRMDEALPGFCLWPAAVQTKNIKKLCPQLWQRINCDGLGNMGICCGVDTMMPPPNNNLFAAEADVVYNHPIMVDMRKKLLDPQSEPPDYCKTCNLLGDSGW